MMLRRSWQSGDGATFVDSPDAAVPYSYGVADTGRIIGQLGSGGLPGYYWDTTTGSTARLLSQLMAHQGLELDSGVTLLTPVAISPDGKTIFGAASRAAETHYRLTLR